MRMEESDSEPSYAPILCNIVKADELYPDAN